MSFEMTFEGVKWCWSSDSSRYILCFKKHRQVL